MRRIYTLALLLAFLFAVSSCSSDVEDEIITQYGDETWIGLNLRQVQYVHGLADGTESLSMKRSSIKFFMREGENGRWHEENIHEWCGLSIPGPSVININNGYSWTPLSLFNMSVGPHPLAMPLSVYRSVTGFDKQFYVMTPVVLNSEDKTIKIDNTTFEILDAGSDGLKLSCIDPFLSSDLTPGEFRFDITYVVTTPSIPSPDKILYFESSREAYLAIVDMLREQFGNEFDINPYLYPDIILDDPIVNLDIIEDIINSDRYTW